MQQRDFSAILVGWHPYLVCCAINFIGCTCLSESGTSSVFQSSKLSVALHQTISISSAHQTLKKLLVLDSARQHSDLQFNFRRPTLVTAHLQSPGQHHGTDNQQQYGHLTLCRISRTTWKLTYSADQFFFFSIHLEHRRPWIGLHVTADEKSSIYYYYYSVCRIYKVQQSRSTNTFTLLVHSATPTLHLLYNYRPPI